MNYTANIQNFLKKNEIHCIFLAIIDKICSVLQIRISKLFNHSLLSIAIVLSFLSSFFHFYHRSANLVAIATKFAVRGIAIRKSLLFHHQFILGHSLHIRLDDGFHLTFHRLTYRRFLGCHIVL